MKRSLWILVLAACGSPPPPITPATTRVLLPAPVKVTQPMQNDEPPPKLLAIDWATTPLANDADAAAVWTQIAPTGADFEEKLDEVPESAARPLAIALLHGGNFTCAPPAPTGDCAPLQFDVPAPANAATLTDPCLRRLVALWALDQLQPQDVPAVLPALRAIVAIPPPESQLVAAAIHAVPEAERALRLELLGIAQTAGQTEVVDASLSTVDEPELVALVTKYHSASALAVLSADGQRSTYLAAVTDDQMVPAARINAIADLLTGDLMAQPPALGADLRQALEKATLATDCGVAAVAIRALTSVGDARGLPKRGKTAAQTMRALCVIASYERLQGADEPSLLAGFVPARGLERLYVSYDPLAETDEDGDGNLHTSRQLDLVPRAMLAVPQVDEVVRAMKHCEGTVCRSANLEVHFQLAARGTQLKRIELFDRPPCPSQGPVR